MSEKGRDIVQLSKYTTAKLHGAGSIMIETPTRVEGKVTYHGSFFRLWGPEVDALMEWWAEVKDEDQAEG